MDDFLFRGSLYELDPALSELAQIEAERQVRKLILIPSESSAPLAVREALASAFQNVYAEGYPDEESRWLTEDELLDYPARLAHYRRYSDPRYYKGVEYADVVEGLARRRCAELFASNGVSADRIFVNVQALSGGPANNAVYHALVQPGDTIMGMNLLHGGHLSHGSPINRSGKYYHAVSYTIDPETEQINYDAVAELARQHKPKFIIAGYSSYPWAVDWKRFREIASSVGAYLFADIAHVAGMVAAGLYPSPVGYADVITFTTHKSLCGPRGACILTTNPTLSHKIDRAVFPGEQGGPHVNTFMAMATAFKLAKTDQFRQLQSQVLTNCRGFTDRFKEHGFRIPYGGTDTHLMNLDCGSITGVDQVTLSGDQAARILDLAGVVVNRNTIPGDKSALDPSGIRMGTHWITQRGFKEPEVIALADIISDILKSTTPYSLEGRKGDMRRAKVDFTVLEEAKCRVRDLALQAGIDFAPTNHGYPHFFYIDDTPKDQDWKVLEIGGERAREFANFAFTCDVSALQIGDSQETKLLTPQGEILGVLTSVEATRYRLTVPAGKTGLAQAWLQDLSDGFVCFNEDAYGKLPGPVWVKPVDNDPVIRATGNAVAADKPNYVGILAGLQPLTPLPDFVWEDKETELRRTPVYETHKRLGARIIPFAGWEMPVWYSSVIEEHLAVRQAAGVFDVAHMGVYQAEGPDAGVFLDGVVGNDASGLEVGESCYTHLLTPDANVVDDLIIYRRGAEKFLIVVNASNDDKDWAWLNAVKQGEVCIDRERPWAKAFGRGVTLRNLRDPKEGADMRVDIALQGPRSRDILLAMGVDALTRQRIMGLQRTQLCEAIVGGYDLVVSRTGYTGEKFSFELFVHPNRADSFFNDLLKAGEPFGLKPIGLGARDSLRTEAGLPLYGHEMGGELNNGVAEGGFGLFVKTYKPWFIGRKAYMAREERRSGEVFRFRFTEKGVRMAHQGDPVLDKKGKVIGQVTSCAVDQEGYLTGQAFIELKSAAEGNLIYIYQSAPTKPINAPAALKQGEKTILPTPALIVSRFQR